LGSPPTGESSSGSALDPPIAGGEKLRSTGHKVGPRSKGAITYDQPADHLAAPVVAEHIAAVNALDNDRIVATFAPDAYVNDNRREIWGIEAIRKFMAKEFVGDHVTMEVREVIDHYGDIIVRAKYDGDYDKTNLPDELIMSSYFALRDGKIVSLAVIFNQPSPY